MPLPSGFEWIVILVIALLILGPGKLPDVAAAVGKSLREFRKASSDVQESVKIDTSPLPAGPAQPGTPPTAQSTEPAVPQPIAPVAPAATAVPPMVTASQTRCRRRGRAADVVAAPTDAAPRANG